MGLPSPASQAHVEARPVTSLCDLARQAIAVPQGFEPGHAGVAHREEQQRVPEGRPGIEFPKAAGMGKRVSIQNSDPPG